MILLQNTQYLFVDMNSFFASCEQQTNEEFRHKPIAVTPVNTANGCIVSASYEAKAFGIKTGTLIKDAKFLCPSLIIRESDVKLYLSFHEKLVRVLNNLSAFVSIRSIDEAVIKLDPDQQNSPTALGLACRLKKDISQNLGKYMRSSVGIGPNVWLAKMAAESKKPDGLVELKLADLPKFFESQKLTNLKGINQRMKIRLNGMEIYSPIQLFLSSSQELRKKMGIMGEYWYQRMHGYNIDILSQNLPKSIGQSHVLEPRYRNWRDAWAVCQKLVERAGVRLRKEKLTASGVFLYIRYLTGPSWNKRLKTSSFSDSQTFLKNVRLLWNQALKNFQPLKIAVTLYGISQPVGYQQKIFSQEQKLDLLYQAIDKINDHYGTFTIKPANILDVGSSAPSRISFGRPMSE